MKMHLKMLSAKLAAMFCPGGDELNELIGNKPLFKPMLTELFGAIFHY